MTRKFTRKIEDFTCLNCGTAVAGNGYTNHCPACLFSRHVDINPGDRAATCGGLMPPLGIETKEGAFVLVHRCRTCGFIRRNRLSEDDSQAKIRDYCRIGFPES